MYRSGAVVEPIHGWGLGYIGKVNRRADYFPEWNGTLEAEWNALILSSASCSRCSIPENTPSHEQSRSLRSVHNVNLKTESLLRYTLCRKQPPSVVYSKLTRMVVKSPQILYNLFLNLSSGSKVINELIASYSRLYLFNLISVQSPHSTCTSSVVTLVCRNLLIFEYHELLILICIIILFYSASITLICLLRFHLHHHHFIIHYSFVLHSRLKYLFHKSFELDSIAVIFCPCIWVCHTFDPSVDGSVYRSVLCTHDRVMFSVFEPNFTVQSSGVHPKHGT